MNLGGKREDYLPATPDRPKPAERITLPSWRSAMASSAVAKSFELPSLRGGLSSCLRWCGNMLSDRLAGKKIEIFAALQTALLEQTPKRDDIFDPSFSDRQHPKQRRTSSFQGSPAKKEEEGEERRAEKERDIPFSTTPVLLFHWVPRDFAAVFGY